MTGDMRTTLTIYSPVLAVLGYPLIYMILGAPLIAIVLAAFASFGAFLFLNYQKDASRYWWVGICYPLLLVLIIITEILSLASPETFRLVAEGMTPARLRGMLYYLIIPFSLVFFAVMTPEFRKLMKIPILIAAFVTVLLLVPISETLSYIISTPEGAISDVTTGFIILILVGFCGIPPLTVFGLIQGQQISKIILSEMQDTPIERENADK